MSKEFDKIVDRYLDGPKTIEALAYRIDELHGGVLDNQESALTTGRGILRQWKNLQQTGNEFGVIYFIGQDEHRTTLRTIKVGINVKRGTL